MIKGFEIVKIKEPNLLFGGDYSTTDPRYGILRFGPYSSLKDGSTEILPVRIGIIGIKSSIEGVKDFLKKIAEPILPNDVMTGKFGFPGIHKDSPIRMTITTPASFQEVISEDQITQALADSKRINRLTNLLAIFESKLSNLAKKDPKPTIVMCAISKEMILKCKRGRFKTKRLIFKDRKFSKSRRGWYIEKDSNDYSGDFNFHNVLKVIAMGENLPTQMIYYDVWEEGLLCKDDRQEFKQQDRVTLAWNLAMALYYKASGTPWKFTKLGKDTLYVGIGFFPEISSSNQVMRASMAQIFLQSGESFILRGDAFEWNPERRDLSPRLTFEQAESLTEQILEQYYQLQNNSPQRIVIHKSSNFYREELAGFREATQMVKEKDYLTIMGTPVKFYRLTNEPIIRGTLIKTEKESYLYTTGYTPTLDQYPGKGIPDPLCIRPYQLDNTIEKNCLEILALTKLDWNNIYYNIRLPVTLSIADKVGEILSEPRAKLLASPLIQYRYYM